MTTPNVGLTVKEGVSSPVSTFTNPAIGNVGVVASFQRGKLNHVYEFSSLADAKKVLGSAAYNNYGYEFLKNLFENASPARLKVFAARIMGANTAVATATTPLTAGIQITFTAANKGEEDPGTWANGTKAELILDSNPGQADKLATINVYDVNDILLESYQAPDVATAVADMNTNSMYVKASITGTFALTNQVAAITNNCNTAGNRLRSENSDGSFTSELYPGATVVTTADINVVVGTVSAVINDNRALLLDTPLSVYSDTAMSYYKKFTQKVTLSGGADGDATSEEDFYPVASEVSPRGLALLTGNDISFVAAPEHNTQTMAVQGRDYAATIDARFVCVTPYQSSATVINGYSTALRNNLKSHISVYDIWGRTYSDDTSIGYKWVPATGAIIGAAARVRYANGNSMHIPPAGIDAVFLGFTDIAPKTLTQTQINDRVQLKGVNVAKFRDGLGYYIASSRTMSSNPLYHSIHILDLWAYYRKVLDENMQWSIQKPNTPDLKNTIVSFLKRFFIAEYNKGALEQSITFDEACVITADETNNPVGQDRKILNVLIEVIPTECVESLVFQINRNDGSLTIQ